MTILDVCLDVGRLRAEEERILASFTGRMIEIAAGAGGRGSSTSPTAALNALRLPAIALDQHGFVADVNATADAVCDHNIKIKDRRLFVRDPDARTHLKDAIDQLKDLTRRAPFEPVIVPRTDKLPVIVRIWPFDGPAHQPGQDGARSFDAQCLGAQARAACGDPRQNIPPDTFGSQARQYRRSRRVHANCCPGAEDF